jgi:LAGLIDADG DNA endonuclease family
MRTLQSFVDNSMLGDGALRLRIKNRERNPKYQFSQIETHTDYVEWIEATLKTFGLTKGSINAKGSWRLETRNSKELLPLYYRWYGYGRKKVPADIRFTWETLAMLIMDDGSNTRGAVQLYTMAFDVEELDVLIGAMYRDLGIHVSINKHHNKSILYIPRQVLTDYGNELRPYVLPSFEYKFEALPKSRKNGEP